MRDIRFLTAALITTLLLCNTAYARQFHRSSTDQGASVAGQVTITNVDSTDSSKRLNGAHVKIVSQDTGNEYTDIIKDNGTLVYQLPLGAYSLTQVLAPNEYQLNSKSYEFTLQVPQGGDVSNIRVVNASVLMTNDLIVNDGGQVSASEDIPAAVVPTGAAPGGVQPLSDQNSTVNPVPVEGVIAADHNPAEGILAAERNPVTADNSNMVLAIGIFCFIIMAGGIASRKYLIK